MDEDHPVGDLAGEADLVGHHDHRHAAFGEGPHDTEDLADQRLTAVERALVEEFLADIADLQQRLYAAAIGHRAIGAPHEEPEVMAQYLQLQTWDRVSLQFALRHAADGVLTAVPGLADRAGAAIACVKLGRFALALDPYPFAEDRVELPVTARLVADRDYADPEDFLAELAAVEPVSVECVASRSR